MRIIKKQIQAKKCKKCGKNLHSKNKSMLCSFHNNLAWVKKKRILVRVKDKIMLVRKVDLS